MSCRRNKPSDGIARWRQSIGRVGLGVAGTAQMLMGFKLVADGRAHAAGPIFGVDTGTVMAFCSSLMLVVASQARFWRQGSRRSLGAVRILDLLAFATVLGIQLSIQQFLRR